MLKRFIILGLSTILFAACSSSDDAGTTTQMQALNASSRALSSIYSSQSGLSLSSRVQSTDVICNTDGSPKATGNDTEWAFNKFLCAGAHNTYSPDSALGALSLASGVVCTAQSLGLTYTESGASVSVTNVAFSTACFPQDMITKFADDDITSLTATVTGFTMNSSTGWDYRIEVRSSPQVGSLDVFIRNSGSVIAAAMINTGDSDGWSISIDRRSSTNSLIYEAANSNTHMRIMAEGTIAADGTVGDVSNMAGIHAMNGSAEYVALRGNDAQGLEISWQKAALGENSTCADIASNGAICTGVTALSFNAAATTAFTDSTAVNNSLALFDNNPISMTVSGFIETPAATAAFSSTLR